MMETDSVGASVPSSPPATQGLSGWRRRSRCQDVLDIRPLRGSVPPMRPAPPLCSRSVQPGFAARSHSPPTVG